MPSSHRLRLLRLLSRSWRPYDRLNGCHHVVRPAVPILFFGNSEEYFNSELRVITVGHNPSLAEFPDGEPFRRFPCMGNGNRGGARHLAALSSYFCTDPYKSWFSSFEPILNGIGSSYYAGRRNAALHTDLCSPIATSPTWSRLCECQRSLLESEGTPLWHSLVEVLKPDVILVSIAQRYLEKIEFPVVNDCEVIWKLGREGRNRPYEVTGRWIRIKRSKRSLLAFGRNVRTPFGSVSNKEKLKMGRAIRRRWCRGN